MYVFIQETETLKLLLEAKLEIENKNKAKLDEAALSEAISPHQKEDGDVACGAISTSKNETLTTSEDEQHNVAGATPIQHDSLSGQGARPKAHQRQDGAGTSENLLTFSRQKLALLQCEYDPKKCSHCGKAASVDNLKQCIKCKTAKYCSKDCQTKDWDRKHKSQCKEIRRLQTQIGERKLISMVPLRLYLCDGPIQFEKNFEYSKLNFFEGKLLLFGMKTLEDDEFYYAFLDVFDPGERKKEVELFRLTEEFTASDYCVLKVGHSHYLLVLILSVPNGRNRSRMELWSQPGKSSKLIHTLPNPTDYSALCICEDKLLFSSEITKTIDEFKVDTIPFKPTGLRIPSGVHFPGSMQTMCVLKEGREKVIAVQYLADEGWSDSIIKGINFQGHKLWQLGGLGSSPFDGTIFQPFGICTDQKGNIFAAEQESNRVMVIRKDRSLQTLLLGPGRVGCIAWCDQSQKLYVMYDIDPDSRRQQLGFVSNIGKNGHMAMSVYEVRE